MHNERKIIMLTDVIEQKLRKERELEFYEKELKKLEERLYWLRREITLNNNIIDIIKNDAIIDLKEQADEKLLIKPREDTAE
tara:strand:- start:1154 stop:1399 length:246 start_codon:yes stop_codon:yes gene_type:complete